MNMETMQIAFTERKPSSSQMQLPEYLHAIPTFLLKLKPNNFNQSRADRSACFDGVGVALTLDFFLKNSHNKALLHVDRTYTFSRGVIL